MTAVIAREWSVADIPSHKLAALREWLALRAQESDRMSDRITRDDANSGPDTFGITDDPNVNGNAQWHTVATVRKTTAGMVDHASRVMPISGVYILPTFGRGGYVAPFIGERDAALPIGPAHERCEHETCSRIRYRDSEAAAWRYVAERTMGDAFAARTIAIMTSEATEHGRPVDHSKRDDVMSEAREIFVGMVLDLFSRDDVARIPNYPLGQVDTGMDDTITGIGEFIVPRLKRCQSCEGCLANESAGRAGRWNVKGCAVPILTTDAVTPSRLITRAIWRAASDRTLSTSAVYATQSAFRLRNAAADLVIEDHVNRMGGDDPLRYVPDGAADLVRFIAAALRAIGAQDDVTPRNGKGMSPVVRAILTRTMGTKDTPHGAETALERARQYWPSEAGTRREAAERARAERKRQADERRNARKRERTTVGDALARALGDA